MAVIGAGGFIGAELVRALTEEGWKVHAVAAPWSDPWRLQDLLDRVALHRADVRERGQIGPLLDTIQPDYVVNSVRYRADFAEGHRRMLDTLVLGTHNLLEAAAAAGCRRFVQLGSASEYGTCDARMDETMAPAPTTVFGGAKAAASMLCLARGHTGSMATAVLRPFMVYGPRDHPSRFVPTIIWAALHGGEVNLTPLGYRRDWVYVGDVVDGCLRALGGGGDGTVVNLGTGLDHANEQLVAVVENLSGRTLKTRVGAMLPRPHDTRRWVASTDRAHALLGWRATTSLTQGLQRTLCWAQGSARETPAAAAGTFG